MGIKEDIKFGDIVTVHGDGRGDGCDDYDGQGVFIYPQRSDCWVWHPNEKWDTKHSGLHYAASKNGISSSVQAAFKRLTGRDADYNDVFSEPYYTSNENGPVPGYITEIIGHWTAISTAIVKETQKDPYGAGPEGETAAYLARGGGLKWL